MTSKRTSCPDSVSEFIENLQAQGNYTFSGADVQAAVPVSEIALANALRRRKKRKRITTPRRGFYVIVPTEYRSAGSPPPSWFIDELMCFLGQPYYVGLLSAAALHGASHQQPMTFQVVTDRPTRTAEAGRIRIEFHMSGLVGATPKIDMQTETGTMRVSTPEATAFDLVRFSESCGGLSNVAILLQEMAERLSPDLLCDLAQHRKTPELQRLGYLLDQAGQPRLADSLLRVLGSRRYRQILLTTSGPAGKAMAVSPWRVVPNVEIELDL